MKIKIEMDLPRWLTRTILIGIPITIVAIGTWVYAEIPNTFKAGDTMSAQKLNDNFAAVAIPPGTVVAFAGPIVPAGWLLCNGDAKSRSAYGTLFATIGTVHGYGDGASTFNLPDYRGAFLRGVDGGKGRDAQAASRVSAMPGGVTGDAVGSIQGDDFGSHRHNLAGVTGSGTWSYADQYYMVPQTSVDPSTYREVIPWQSFFHMTAAGGSETRPKNAYVNYIIKY